MSRGRKARPSARMRIGRAKPHRSPLSAGLALALGLACAARAAPPFSFGPLDSALLRPNGISDGDLDLLPESSHPPHSAFRLAVVERLLRHPLSADSVVGAALDLDGPGTPAGAPAAAPGNRADTLARRTAADAGPLSPARAWPWLDVPAPAERPLAPGFDLGAALGAVRAGLRDFLAPLAPAERDFLYREAPPFFLQEEEDTSLAPVPAELKRLESDFKARRLYALAGKLDLAKLAAAAQGARETQRAMVAALRADTGKARDRLLARWGAQARRAGVPFHVGGPGNDRHAVGEGVWIDLGGDDEYDFVPVDKPGALTMVIDLAGDDRYVSRDSLARGAGNMGISLLSDLAGSDRYEGRNFAWGSALFGYSHLYDAGGSDAYSGRCASLGFAFFGLGILEDAGGSDTYAASLLSEGASSTKGFGLLLDRGGDDTYLAKPTFLDDLRYNDHHIHMCQGFSTGLAPDYAGGVGLLWDRAGHDTYVADIFAQGCGYWYGLGMLLDESGNDRYEAYQYAQGAGVHLAVGLLADLAGDDHHYSKGVSLGCGHDYGFGLLLDRSGDDDYLATDMSLGAGSANGLGVLLDLAGNDAYMAKNPDMALGHGDMRRDRGSFGLFLDAGGKDRYPPEHGDGSAWTTFGAKVGDKEKGNGYGLDR